MFFGGGALVAFREPKLIEHRLVLCHVGQPLRFVVTRHVRLLESFLNESDVPSNIETLVPENYFEKDSVELTGLFEGVGYVAISIVSSGYGLCTQVIYIVASGWTVVW